MGIIGFDREIRIEGRSRFNWRHSSHGDGCLIGTLTRRYKRGHVVKTSVVGRKTFNMDKSGYNIIWKMEDVKNYKSLWTFTDKDLEDLFVKGVDNTWYNEFLNDVVEDLVLGKEKPIITGSYWTSSQTYLTEEEMDAYMEWSEEPTKEKNLKKRPEINFDFVFEPEDDFGITVTMVGDKLAITSEDIKVLNDLKEIFVKAGNIVCDHYKKKHKGFVFHTYVFIIENQI
jgi:hypothetical protein